MHQFIYPYILLDDTLEAANYYKKMFQGEIVYVMKGKDMPECPEDKLENIMHLQLKFNDNSIYMADSDHTKGNFVQIHLDFENKDDLKKAFDNFRPESKVMQDLEDKFWGAYFGVLEDKYGVVWQFHYAIPQE